MRQIVLDTETTGLEPAQGHRIIEIGCVELADRRLTGNDLHLYIHPDREIDQGAIVSALNLRVVAASQKHLHLAHSQPPRSSY